MTSRHARDQVFLVVGIGSHEGRDDRPYREYLLRAAADRHAVWLFENEMPTWQSDYAAGSTVLNLFDTDEMIRATKSLAARHDVVGVLCPDEAVLRHYAAVVDFLGLPGLSAATAANCRDKKTSRRLLTEAGVAQPGFTTVRSAEEARAAAAELGYPVVVKPRTLGASYGVVGVHRPEEMAEAFAVSTQAGYPGVEVPDDYLVEQFLTGEEISIDGVVYDGRYRAMFVAHKKVADAPYFVEVGHTVFGDDPLVEDGALIEMLQEAHRALGITHGATHTEVKLTPRGPVIVEINGRPGGDLVPRLGEMATGIDVGAVCVDAVTGREPLISRTRSKTVSIRFLRPEQDLVLRSVDLSDTVALPGVVEAGTAAAPGSVLRRPPHDYVARYAYIIVEGGNEKECAELLDRAERTVRLDFDPLESE
ncbi:ATP-grasp domain-containing protein [Streptomyces sp. NPDC005955]|uniref:ATP-grasp domain-containing protein n=1 Tax=Streptomyces sp. NPDC005955 TaxID=3364738 RepID=UPI003675385A